jgi:hypothetical protein
VWLPLHLIYLGGELIHRALGTLSLLHPVPFQLFRDIKVPLTTIQAILVSNSDALLTPTPDGWIVVFYAMLTGARPYIIHAMVEAQSSKTMMRAKGNLLIHSMIMEQNKGKMHLFMRYLKIVVNKNKECLLERDGGGLSCNPFVVSPTSA